VYEPARGLRFNPSKLVLDPYAQALAGQVTWGAETFGYTFGHPEGDLVIDHRDSAWCLPKCVVVNPNFDWTDDELQSAPLHTSIIYEMHVKGFSMLNPEVLQLCSHPVIGWQDAPPGIFGLWFIQVAAM
jgi:isoamylase